VGGGGFVQCLSPPLARKFWGRAGEREVGGRCCSNCVLCVLPILVGKLVGGRGKVGGGGGWGGLFLSSIKSGCMAQVGSNALKTQIINRLHLTLLVLIYVLKG
jgi:hypothetical protein